MYDKIFGIFNKNTIAWILFGFLIFGLYSNYQNGREFTEVCERVLMLSKGYYDPDSARKFITKGINLNDIMVSATKREKLWKEDSSEGRAYRWWRHNVRRLERICGNRLAEPYPEPDQFE